jgi:hypothetical protein
VTQGPLFPCFCEKVLSEGNFWIFGTRKRRSFEQPHIKPLQRAKIMVILPVGCSDGLFEDAFGVCDQSIISHRLVTTRPSPRFPILILPLMILLLFKKRKIIRKE